MHLEWIYAILSTFLVSLIALIGIVLAPIKPKKLEKFLIYFVSFSAGALFGGAFFHLIPEVVNEVGFTFIVSSLLLGGIVISFIIEKVVHWHYNFAFYEKEHPHPFAIMSLIGGSFHNLLDGLVIGASYLINIPTGIAITSAIALHKIPKEMGWFGILVHGGLSKTRALCFNYISSLTTIVGAVLALIAGNYLENIQFFIVPLAAGGIIYLAGSDLIPELHKEKGITKSILQLLSLLAGICVMALLLLVR
tara:strand:+ start:62 stop:811 length:750 start_codon:yes stop_codon:yes gene_type:complete